MNRFQLLKHILVISLIAGSAIAQNAWRPAEIVPHQPTENDSIIAGFDVYGCDYVITTSRNQLIVTTLVTFTGCPGGGPPSSSHFAIAEIGRLPQGTYTYRIEYVWQNDGTREFRSEQPLHVVAAQIPVLGDLGAILLIGSLAAVATFALRSFT